MTPQCEFSGCQTMTRRARRYCNEHWEPRQQLRGGGAYRQHTSFKEDIRQRDNDTCQVCGAPGQDVDHIVPYAVSGETRPEGVRVLCHRCNMATRRPQKNARLPYDEWIAKLEAELCEEGA